MFMKPDAYSKAEVQWFSIVHPRANPRRTAFCSLVLLAIAFSIYIRIVSISTNDAA